MTPTQDLIMEVLAARWRLGHTAWLFDTTVRAQVRALEAKGLVGFKSAVVQGNLMVWLTEDGRREVLDEGYVAPILQQAIRA